MAEKLVPLSPTSELHSVVLFIDSNQYLDLYLVAGARKLLPALQELKDRIFVPAQIVDEVNRGKLRVVSAHLSEQLRRLETVRSFAPPDHLLSEKHNGVGELRAVLDALRRISKWSMGSEILEAVSKSEDEVSKALADIFAKPAAPSPDELQRARKRKESGNPPGKKGDPLGDQLAWEQLLTRCKGVRQLWIITKDSDYAVRNGGKMLLNPLLYGELMRATGVDKPEVFCFDSMTEGIRQFAKATKAATKELPSDAEAEQIKKEEQALPPLGWLTNYDDAYIPPGLPRMPYAWLYTLANESLPFPPLKPKDDEKDKS